MEDEAELSVRDALLDALEAVLADDDHAEHEQRVQQTLLPFGQIQGHDVGTDVRTEFTDRPR